MAEWLRKVEWDGCARAGVATALNTARVIRSLFISLLLSWNLEAFCASIQVAAKGFGRHEERWAQAWRRTTKTRLKMLNSILRTMVPRATAAGRRSRRPSVARCKLLA